MIEFAVWVLVTTQPATNEAEPVPTCCINELKL